LNDHILIGTPGKLLDWGTKLRCFDLTKVEVFVLDEADVMIATQGHQDQSIRIHKYVSMLQLVYRLNTLYQHLFFHHKVATEIVPDDVVLRHI